MGIELYFFYSSHPVPQLHSFSVIPLSIFPSPALSLSLFFPAMQFHYLLYIWLSLPLLQLWFSLLTLRFSEMLKTRLSPFPPPYLLYSLHIFHSFSYPHPAPCSVFFLSQPCNISGKKSLYMPKTKKIKKYPDTRALERKKVCSSLFLGTNNRVPLPWRASLKAARQSAVEPRLFIRTSCN